MSLHVCVLASGSSGNATLVRGPDGAVLVDAGLSLKELGLRLEMVGCPVDELVGVLVTHEHTDHVSGAGGLARRHKLPVWLSRGTAEGAARHWRGDEDLRFLRDGDRWQVAGMEFDCWSCPHDALEPLQFGIRVADAGMAVCTDLGLVTDEIAGRLSGRHLLVMEANHDRERLLAGPYPWFLKKRILGDRGHLSNAQCADLLAHVAGSGLKRVVLGHVSRENNRPEMAAEAAGAALARAGHAGISLTIAGQDEPGPWLDVFSGRTC